MSALEGTPGRSRARTLAPIRAIGLILLLSLIWGYNWVVMKVAMTDAPPLAFAALRFLGASLVLIGFLKLSGRSLRLEAPLPIFLIGLFQTAGNFALVMFAVSLGEAGRSAILTYTMPFWVLALSYLLLAERAPRVQWLVCLVALTGILLIAGSGSGAGALLSILLALGGGLSWGLGVVVSKWANNKRTLDPVALTAWQMLMGALMLGLLVLVVPERPIAWTAGFWAALLYNIFPGTALAYVIWFFLLSRLDVGLAALAILATPLIGILLSGLQLGERPGLAEGTGMGLILLAIASLALVERQKARGIRIGRIGKGKG